MFSVFLSPSPASSHSFYSRTPFGERFLRMPAHRGNFAFVFACLGRIPPQESPAEGVGEITENEALSNEYQQWTASMPGVLASILPLQLGASVLTRGARKDSDPQQSQQQHCQPTQPQNLGL